METSVAFRIVEVATLAIVAAGLALRARYWLAPRGETRAFIARVLSPGTVRAVVLDGFLQLRLLRRGRVRWAAHQLIFWSFVELFSIGSLGDMFGARKDAPAFAFANDAGGVAIVAGAAMALALWSSHGERRRYRHPAEPIVLAWLLALALTGYVLEAVRWLDAGGGAGTAWAFGGTAARVVIRPLDLDWGATHDALWWAHAALAMPLIAYIPYGLLRHTFGAPITIGVRASERGMNAVPAKSPYPWRGLSAREPDRALTPAMRLQLDACVSCAECTMWCEAVGPAGADAPAGVAPSVRVQQLRQLAGVADGPWHAVAEDPFLCTLCGRCAAVCPEGIDLPSIWKTARAEVAGRGLAPAGLSTARDAVVGEHNVVNYPNIERDLWVDYATYAPADGWRRERADVLYYVGCMTSFSPAAQNIAVTFAEVMEHAGVNFAILGNNEWCCGFPMYVAGMLDELDALRSHNIARLTSLGAKAVVFNCPSCFYSWRKLYAAHLPEGVELYHATQFIAKLLAEGRLRPEAGPLTVTYHDPCDLGRNSGVYDEPREVLRQLPGVTLREPEFTRELAHCCGGGGDLEIVKPDLATSICANTLTELRATGADALVVACPQCKRMFQAAARKQAPDFEVVDIIELVHRVTVDAARPVAAGGGG